MSLTPEEQTYNAEVAAQIAARVFAGLGDPVMIMTTPKTLADTLTVAFNSYHEYLRTRPQHESGDPVCVEEDGCPTERAVLQRFWRQRHAPRYTCVVKGCPGTHENKWQVCMDRG